MLLCGSGYTDVPYVIIRHNIHLTITRLVDNKTDFTSSDIQLQNHYSRAASTLNNQISGPKVEILQCSRERCDDIIIMSPRGEPEHVYKDACS